MRKETIIKYEKEFIAWCKGESVLLGETDPTHDRTLIWREVRDFNDWKPLDTVYVLNDSYSIYRKALAEGKPIQMYCKYDDVPPFWDDMTEVIRSIGFVDIKENYRIKPEEPKFKVGDWVVEIHSTTKAQVLELFGNQIRVKFCYPDAIITTDSSDFIPWIPKKGDWCWFLNKSRIPVISQFHSLEIEGNRKYSATFPNTPHPMIGYYDYCEPFIGNLPTTLQK